MTTAASSERGRVWILEDSALEAEMARRALAGTQDVEIFTDGLVLLDRVASGSMADALVLDWQLVGLTGVEVCRVLRSTLDPMALPILMLTAQGDKSDIVEALRAGANDYVTKPYDVAELVARVGTLVRTSRLNAMQARRARQLALSSDIGAALTKGQGLEASARQCADAIATHTDAGAVEVWTMRAGELVRVASRVNGAASIPEDIVRRAARERLRYVNDDDRDAAGGCGAGASVAAMPLAVGDEIVGAVAFCTRVRIADSVEMLATVSDLLALGIARIRFEEERAGLLERERSTRAEAEAANRSKDEFLAMVSHELRTPLSAITGWTSMLLSGNLEADRVQRALETIDRNARAQAQLIDDLLDISRIISGRLRLNVGTVDVAQVAEMALESLRLAADARGVHVAADIDFRSGEVSGDADRIQQVIWNLLSNAIKFTPKGGRVELTVGRDERGIRIGVRDTGQGIAPEFLAHVFERFKQADGTMTRSKGGLGLGLAIVRHLVELHGGTVEAHSAGLGQGALFEVRLPPEANPRAESQRTISVRPFERPREVEGLRVLVVDDEADARDLLRTLLESCNVEVTTAGSAAEAFAALARVKPDVLVSDIAMPEEDGLSFIRRVRGLPREAGGRTPAVALTAYARLEDRTRALRSGFNAHVAKPVDPTELLAVVSSLVSR